MKIVSTEQAKGQCSLKMVTRKNALLVYLCTELLSSMETNRLLAQKFNYKHKPILYNWVPRYIIISKVLSKNFIRINYLRTLA